MHVNYEIERQRHISSIYVHTDDISEERLRVLWLEAHPPTVDAPDSVDVSQDQTHVETTQETVPTNGLTGGERVEGREVDGEGGEGGAGGSGEEGQVLDGAVEKKSQEEEGGEGEGEGGDSVKEDRAGEEGENEGKEDVEVEGKGEEREKEGGAGGEKVQENCELEDQTADRMTGFGEEPFVQAAAKFSRYELGDILELLTQAIDAGE